MISNNRGTREEGYTLSAYKEWDRDSCPVGQSVAFPWGLGAEYQSGADYHWALHLPVASVGLPLGLLITRKMSALGGKDFNYRLCSVCRCFSSGTYYYAIHSRHSFDWWLYLLNFFVGTVVLHCRYERKVKNDPQGQKLDRGQWVCISFYR